MVTATTNPSSSLASLFGKVITHHQNQKVEQIKGSASLTHSYAQPQPSQDPPALHQDNDQGKIKKKKRKKEKKAHFYREPSSLCRLGKQRPPLQPPPHPRGAHVRRSLKHLRGIAQDL